MPQLRQAHLVQKSDKKVNIPAAVNGSTVIGAAVGFFL
jgi:hypothetical protein